MLAAVRGHVDLCRLLLEFGADARLIDNAGHDAPTIAISRGHVKAADLIVSYSTQAIEGARDEQLEVASCGRVDREIEFLPMVGPSQACFGSDPIADRCGPIKAAPESSTSGTGDAYSLTYVMPDLVPLEPDYVAGLSTSDLSSSLSEVLEQAPAADTMSLAFGPRDDGWEAEDDPVLSPDDTCIEQLARDLHLLVSAHQPIVFDMDWSDVEIDLPVAGRLWTRGFHPDFDAVRHVGKFLLEAMHEGRTLEQDIDLLISNTPSGRQDERLEHDLRDTVEALGIVIEDGSAAAYGSSDALPHTSEGKASFDRSLLRDVFDRLDDLASNPFRELGLIEIVARGSPPVVGAQQERQLFLRHQASLDAVIRLASPHAATRIVLLEWISRLEEGEVFPSDLTRRGQDQHEIPNDIETHDGATPEHSRANETGALVDNLRQTMALNVDEFGDKLIALSLSPARVIELAERTLASFEGGAQVTGKTGPADAISRSRLASALRDLEAIRDLLVRSNLRLVIWQARRYSSGPLPIADLVQEGIIGLLRSIDRFDLDKGSRFGTYAIWWIRQAISRAMQDQGRTVRIPVHMLQRHNKLRKVEERLSGRLGRRPFPGELAIAMGDTVDTVSKIEGACIEMIPLDQIFRAETSDFCDEQMDDDHVAGMAGSGPSALDTILHSDLRRRLVDALRLLGHREQKVLALRFGLEDGVSHTLEEVGQIYGVTRERIRQIESKALKRMIRKLPVRDFESLHV